MKASEIIINEKKLKKKDHSEEEWALIKAAKQARHVMGELLSRTVSNGIKIMLDRGYEFNYQYASSMAKRMAPGMLLLIKANNKDREKILKQITGALMGTASSHPEYGEIQKDEFVDVLLHLISSEFENYKQTIELI